jgi:solute:Na+ symporter, SSS family
MALIGSGLVVIAQFALFLVIGLGLWSFYEAREFGRTDEIFATFIIEQLPAGVTGIVIAAIFAAAMSSLSSSVNSLASASTYDFYAPLRGRGEAELFRVGRLFTLLWGAILVGGALLFRSRETPVVELGLAIASFTYGGLLGGFFLGILNRRANQRDAIVAVAMGMLIMSGIVFGKVVCAALRGDRVEGFGETLVALGSIAFPWHVVIGTAGDLHHREPALAHAPPAARRDAGTGAGGTGAEV